MKQVRNKGMSATQVISQTQDEFRFRLENSDTEYALPLIQDLPVKRVQALARGGEKVGIDEIIDLFDALVPGFTDTATQRDLAAVMDAWAQASNTTLGE